MGLNSIGPCTQEFFELIQFPPFDLYDGTLVRLQEVKQGNSIVLWPFLIFKQILDSQPYRL